MGAPLTRRLQSAHSLESVPSSVNGTGSICRVVVLPVVPALVELPMRARKESWVPSLYLLGASGKDGELPAVPRQGLAH